MLLYHLLGPGYECALSYPYKGTHTLTLVYGKWLLIPLFCLLVYFYSSLCANVFIIVILVYYFKILFSRLVRSFEWIVFENIKKAVRFNTYYFLIDDLQMPFKPIHLFKIFIIVVISIGILGRSLVYTEILFQTWNTKRDVLEMNQLLYLISKLLQNQVRTRYFQIQRSHHLLEFVLVNIYQGIA